MIAVSTLSLSALQAQSSMSLEQALGQLSRSITKENATRIRENFFDVDGTLNAIATTYRAAAESENPRTFNSIHRMIDEKLKDYNTRAASWLRTNRGLTLGFQSGMTEYEKADYYSQIISRMDYWADQGISGGSATGSRLGLHLHVFRDSERTQQLRDLFGSQVADRLGIKAYQDAVASYPRVIRLNRTGQNETLYAGTYDRIVTDRTNAQGQPVVRIEAGPRAYEYAVEAGASLEALKSVPSQMYSYDLQDGSLAFGVGSQNVSGYSLGDGFLVVTGANTPGHYQDEWVYLQNPEDNPDLLSRAQAILVHDPLQAAAIYENADGRFRQRIEGRLNEIADREARKILNEQRVQQSNQQRLADDEAAALLRSIQIQPNTPQHCDQP